MKFCFDVDVAGCLRRGIDAPGKTVKLDVDPATIPTSIRAALAERLVGCDVHALALESNIKFGAMRPDGKHLYLRPPFRKVTGRTRLLALAPTLEGLLAAIRADDLRVEELIEAGQPITQEEAGERLRPKKSPRKNQ